MFDAAPPLKTLLARGARKRCPRCGEGPLFRYYNVLHERCSVCGLKYLEDEGALFGYLFLIDRALFLFPLIAMIFFRLYVPGARWFYALFAATMFALVYTLPHRAGMSLALDYRVRHRRSDGPPGAPGSTGAGSRTKTTDDARGPVGRAAEDTEVTMARLEPVNPWKWQDALGFSQAVSATGGQRVLFCAGQTSVDGEGNPLNPGDLAAQLGQAIDNLETVLKQAGLGLSSVVRLNYYTTDVDAFMARGLAVAAERLGGAGCRPAATLLGVQRLFHPDIVIEIEATAIG